MNGWGSIGTVLVAWESMGIVLNALDQWKSSWMLGNQWELSWMLGNQWESWISMEIILETWNKINCWEIVLGLGNLKSNQLFFFFCDFMILFS